MSKFGAISFHFYPISYRLSTLMNLYTYFGDFNARIGQRRPGEEEVLGEHCFGREAMYQVEIPNRDLLLEFCSNRKLIVGNTLLISTRTWKASCS